MIIPSKRASDTKKRKDIDFNRMFSEQRIVPFTGNKEDNLSA